MDASQMSLTEEWIKMYVYTREYYTAIKRK